MQTVKMVVTGPFSSGKTEFIKAISEIELPRGTTIAAIVRDNKVIIAHHNIVVQTDDHIILFLVRLSK